MDGPLDGIRVLEVANWVAAPAAATLLADLGASVIKVEPPQGDISRGYTASPTSLSSPPPSRSGIMSLVGDRDGPPVVTRPGFGDHTTAIVLAYGIMVALYDRERTGKGQEIQASLLNSAMWALGGDLQAALAGREPL